MFSMDRSPQHNISVLIQKDRGMSRTPDFFSEALESPSDFFPHEEGQLAVDVLDTKKEIIILSTVAGAVPEKIDVSVHHDLVTIRGVRAMPAVAVDDISYLYQECFWGAFSRTIVLPVDVKGEFASAEYKNGVLTIRIPKKSTDIKIPIRIVDE